MSQLLVPIPNTDLWNRISFATLVRETDDYQVHVGDVDAASIRITTLSKQLSEQPEFRAEFRTDIRQLQQLKHTSIASTIDWGEHDGAIFYVTEIGSGIPLQDFLQRHTLKWEEFVDISWQISSALQHVHNAGFTHGALHQDSILIDDTLRISVCDFGLHRWIHKVHHPTLVPLFPDAAQSDLEQFSNLLEWLICQIPDEITDRLLLQISDIKDLIRQSRDPRNEVMARDFQGHLGDLLLRDTGDVIDMIDHREGQQTSRRSIVDELFDDENQFKSNNPDQLTLPNKPDYIVAGLILLLLGFITVLLVLGY